MTIKIFWDNLNTHTKGAFYEAFPAEKAREIVKRIEFHPTPKPWELAQHLGK